MNYSCYPSQFKSLSVEVPFDKSITHRALILASIAEGPSILSGVLLGEDCLATMHALRQLGVSLTVEGHDCQVEGRGLRGLQQVSSVLDCANSGTGMRLLAGVLAGQSFSSALVGDASLTRRPMKRIIEPLKMMGACIEGSEQGTPPLYIYPSQTLHGIEYVLPVASAQVKSCLLLAGLYANSATYLEEPIKTRDHTERMLPCFGAQFDTRGSNICIYPRELRGGELKIPRDFSSAAFFIALAAVIPGSNLELKQVGINPHRTGLMNVLEQMGASLELFNVRHYGSEPVADIRVCGGALKGVLVPADVIPSMIDEIPALCIAASMASGVTRLCQVGELRVKESNRLLALVKGLQALGIQAYEEGDDLVIVGGVLRGGLVDCVNDHRIAMTFMLMSFLSKEPIELRSCQGIATSFPGFIAMSRMLGLTIVEQESVNV